MALIELKNVSKSFGRLVVLDGLDLSIEAGQSLVVIGASGTGKSVLLKHIVGLLKPDDGEVWFDAQRVDLMPERQLMELRTRFGFLFQMGALFDSLTVGENIAFPLQEHTDKPPQEIARVVSERLEMVGLPGIERKMPAQLSGGQRKRVALARAIALEPQVILYDEPTTGLDPVRSDVINRLILKLNNELHVTSITVTHDMASAFKVADRIVMLHEGKIIFDGTADQIRRTEVPLVRQFVRGEATESELEALDEAETHRKQIERAEEEAEQEAAGGNR
ncbi:MAG TPA: ABC transporter ATP-binding protein [Tepidisphaeraceae bacterium]|jgi:phospholipid/cholesterol/gamma-HCH transport system ATP-binding protein